MHCVRSSLFTGPENKGVSCNNYNAIDSYPNQNKVDQVLYNWQQHNTWLECICKSDHITAIGCRSYLPLSVVKMKSKRVIAENPHCHNGVVDMFGHGLSNNP